MSPMRSLRAPSVATLALVAIGSLDAEPQPAPAEGPALEALFPRIMDERAALEDIPFPELIRIATGHRVEPFDPSAEADARILAALVRALDAVLAEMNRPDSPVRDLARINEASAEFEEGLRGHLASTPGIACTLPLTAAGTPQRSGYPDLRIEDRASGTIYYLDPKLYARGSGDTTLRTFYYEPRRETNKISEDARHLLVGIEHDGADGAWRFLRWHLVDLSRFRVRLKAEFQASNRDLYRPETIVASGGSPVTPPASREIPLPVPE